MKNAAGLRPGYVAPTVWSLDSEGVRDLLGPVESQYVMTTVGQSCLPLNPTGDTVQDDWEFAVPADPTRVNITVDVLDTQVGMEPNAGCSATPNCGTPPDPTRGPLDPKIALYEPGVTPTAGPFNGFFNAADCADAITGETGCVGLKPPDSCILCDNAGCAHPGIAGNECASLDVTLSPAGVWTVSVAAEAPNLVPQSEGCYMLTVTDMSGTGIGQLNLVADDSTVTFVP